MEQPNPTLYGSSTYSSMMAMPPPLPLRTATEGPTTPDTCQRSFDESSYFEAVPQEILHFPVTALAENSLDPWFMDIPGSASPQSTRLSMSPSQGAATPSSDGFYSPPYSEQLQLPPHHFLEQPQPVRSCSTSHPNWVSNGANWEYDYAESGFWSAQPYVAQPWVSNTYDCYATQNMATGHTSTAPTRYTSHLSQPQGIQRLVIASHGSSPSGSDVKEEKAQQDEDSSDEESDWDEEATNDSQSETLAYRSKPKTKASRLHVDKWSVDIATIQQSEARNHKCTFPGCTSSFVRPEHHRRHVKSKHVPERLFPCQIEGCKTKAFSRGDNLRDHYWTHLDRGGRIGKNKKFTLQELKETLGPKEKKLIRRLREKQRQHEAKERLKRQRVAQAAYLDRS